MHASSSLTAPPASLVVIGNFDGVHRGHQAVLRAAAQAATELGLAAKVLTFHPHPASVLGKKQLRVLTSLSHKVALIEGYCPTIEVSVVQFTLEFAQLSAEEFVEGVLVRQLGARVVVVGENFRFGRGRSGDFSRLVELGARFGFEPRSEPLLSDETGPLSSSRIRELLAEGDVGAAQALLGRPHSVTGKVGHGDHRGRTIGFPTANLEDIGESLPLDGVYVARVLGGGVPMGNAVVNVGARPTVERPFSVEAHVLDFSGDLYGASLTLEFVGRIRGTQKFVSLEALQDQIARDVLEGRRMLEGRPTLEALDAGS